MLCGANEPSACCNKVHNSPVCLGQQLILTSACTAKFGRMLLAGVAVPVLGAANHTAKQKQPAVVSVGIRSDERRHPWVGPGQELLMPQLPALVRDPVA